MKNKHRTFGNSGFERFYFYLIVGSCLLLALIATGCHLAQGVASLPANAMQDVIPGVNSKQGNQVNVMDLQGQLMRFSDELVMRVQVSVQNIQRDTNAINQANQVELLQWRAAYCSDVWSIASEQNAVAGLLDMMAAVTLGRMGAEDYFISKYGPVAQPMLKNFKTAETQIWALADKVMKPQQEQEFRTLIEHWHAQNPDTLYTFATRALGFTAQLSSYKSSTSTDQANQPANVFSLLNMDPLAGLDPATREIAKTRQFAERALFIAQRMPIMVRWQTELLACQTGELPAVKQVLTNAAQMSASVEVLSQAAKELPDRFSEEREKILEALREQTPVLTALTTDAEEALAAGSQMASNVNITLKTFSDLVTQLNSGPPPDPDAPSSRPFRIQDYTAAAAQIDVSAQQLTKLLQQFETTLGSTNLYKLTAELAPVVQQAQSGGKEVVDYAFRKAILLAVICCVLIFFTVLVYRWLCAKLGLSSRSKTGPPPAGQ